MVQLHWNEFKQSSVLSLTFNTSILKEQMLWLKFLSWNGPDCCRTIREIKPESKCFCNYPIPTSFPLDYRMEMLPRLSDNITCDMSLSSSFPHVIISTRMRRKSEYKSIQARFFLNKWRHDGIYQFFGLHFKLASLQSDPDVRNSPWRWKATPLRLCLIWPFIITWIPISPTDLISGQIRDHLPEVFLLIVAQRKEDGSDVSASSKKKQSITLTNTLVSNWLL